MNDQIPRCPWRTFQARGIKMSQLIRVWSGHWPQNHKLGRGHWVLVKFYEISFSNCRGEVKYSKNYQQTTNDRLCMIHVSIVHLSLLLRYINIKKPYLSVLFELKPVTYIVYSSDDGAFLFGIHCPYKISEMVPCPALQLIMDRMNMRSF